MLRLFSHSNVNIILSLSLWSLQTSWENIVGGIKRGRVRVHDINKVWGMIRSYERDLKTDNCISILDYWNSEIIYEKATASLAAAKKIWLSCGDSRFIITGWHFHISKYWRWGWRRVADVRTKRKPRPGLTRTNLICQFCFVRRFIQSLSKFCPYLKNTFWGLFTKWICEINTTDFGVAPLDCQQTFPAACQERRKISLLKNVHSIYLQKKCFPLYWHHITVSTLYVTAA